MKVLVIPDIHGRKFWRNAINNNIEKVDKIIFLGDYLDPYQNEIEENPELMECEYFGDSKNLLKMLEDIIGLKKNEPDKYILLTGNHSDSYIWSKFHAATRTDYKNWEKYHKVFSQNLEYFNLVWTENDTIFSHAGISEDWAKILCTRMDNKFESVLRTSKILGASPVDEIHNNDKLVSLLGQISYYRGGDYNHGSCEWADLREYVDLEQSVFDIVPKGEEGIYQIFGHTQVKQPLITDKWACLDCRKAFIIDTKTHNIEDASNSSL